MNFSNFSKSQLFFPIWILIVLMFTVRRNCSSDLKIFANSRPSASNFKFFSRSLEHFFLTVGQNNFGNKIPFLYKCESLCGIRCWLFWTIFSSIKWDRLPHMHLKDFAFKDGISNEVNHLTFYVLWETWFDEHGCLILIWWLRILNRI